MCGLVEAYAVRCILILHGSLRRHVTDREHVYGSAASDGSMTPTLSGFRACLIVTNESVKVESDGLAKHRTLMLCSSKPLSTSRCQDMASPLKQGAVGIIADTQFRTCLCLHVFDMERFRSVQEENVVISGILLTSYFF